MGIQRSAGTADPSAMPAWTAGGGPLAALAGRVHAAPAVWRLVAAGLAMALALAVPAESAAQSATTGAVVASPAHGTAPTARANITVPASDPVAQPAAMTVPLNTATTLDLSPFISGTGVTGIAIATHPTHGTAEVNGTKVTYTPKQNYFGADAFTYYAIGTAGSSLPALVSVTVTGRPDPSKDANVVGLIDGQAQVARRFARAQISNFQRRMESLHVDPPNSAAPAPAAGGGTAPGGASVGPANGLGVWVGGNLSFGSQNSSEQSAGTRYSTDGVTIGGDGRLSDRLVVGLGVGYAQDKTSFGNDGTQLKSDGTSIAAYGSYQPTRSTFIDALLGYGTLNFDSNRYVSSVDDFAIASRTGSQIFGSVAGGYEYRDDGLLLSPYGRLDFTYAKLDQVSESGAGLNALSYLDQTQRSVQVSLGLRAESQHAASFGLVRPRARAEYRHDVDGGNDATVSYADQRGGPVYTVTPTGTKRDFVLLGVGSDFIFRNGLRLGVDYRWQSSGGADSGQAVQLQLAQELDGKGWTSSPWTARALADPVRVDTAFTYDDNVTRGRVTDEILADKIYGLNLGTSRTFPVNDNSRVVVSAMLNGEMFHRYTGLAHLSGGLQAELQYRGSADFDAVTFTAFARGWLDNYQSSLRDGGRYTFGVGARRALTDRIEAYGELSANGRRARSAVWDGVDYAARLNLDYSLGRSGTFYFTGEYHQGDTVSDGKASLVNLSIAEVFVPDDAFPGDGLFAYRFNARTWVGMLGYNLPLGPQDSIDFSWRRVQSTPTTRPSFDTSESLRYVDNQYTILYLLRF